MTRAQISGYVDEDEKQTFAAHAEAADGTLEWLEWAREALGLRGDRCEWDPHRRRRGETPRGHRLHAPGDSDNTRPRDPPL